MRRAFLLNVYSIGYNKQSSPDLFCILKGKMNYKEAAYLFDLIPDYLKKYHPRTETQCTIREVTAHHEAGHILIAIKHDLEFKWCRLNENGVGAKIKITEPENDTSLYAKYLLAGLLSQHLFTGKLDHVDYCKDFAILVCLDGLVPQDVCDIMVITIEEILSDDVLIKSIATDLINKNKLDHTDISGYRS